MGSYPWSVQDNSVWSTIGLIQEHLGPVTASIELLSVICTAWKAGFIGSEIGKFPAGPINTESGTTE